MNKIFACAVDASGSLLLLIRRGSKNFNVAVPATLLFLVVMVTSTSHSMALESDLLNSNMLESSVLANEAKPVSETLKGKSQREAADIKSDAIVKLKIKGNHARGGIAMEIESVKKIEGGIEIFARAWKGDRPIGFGDGTVEIERFIIMNPAILVPDGTFTEIEQDEGGGIVHKVKSPNFKEDLEEALLQTLAHAIEVTGKDENNIYPGKRGHTTYVVHASVDGRPYVGNSGSMSWASLRAANGDSLETDSSPTNVSTGSLTTTNEYYIHTMLVFMFDTGAALPDLDTVYSATFSAVSTAKYTDWSEELNITLATTSSNSIVSMSDYQDTIGPSADTKLSDDKAISSLDVGGATYSNWTLNSTGLSNVNRTGLTKIALRTVNDDIENGSPSGWTSLGTAGAGFKMSEDGAGTTLDPKLVIVQFTVGEDFPSAPTSLLTNGQTNPTNLTSSTPDFSAIYNDADSGDHAVSYEIQVATSSSFTNTYWDSGKTTLASTTAQGTSIDEITYGGSALASSTTYYWRIKFWDAEDGEGAWSTDTATFSLAANNPSKVRKSVNESLQSSISLQSDDELRTVLNGNTTYVVDGVIFATSTSATPDLLVGFTGPSGATIDIGYTSGSDEEVLTAGATSSRIPLQANIRKSIHFKGTIKTSSSSGDFTVKWAQATSNSAATTVLRGSYIRLDPI